jgi:hypothetical protein
MGQSKKTFISLDTLAIAQCGSFGPKITPSSIGSTFSKKLNPWRCFGNQSNGNSYSSRIKFGFHIWNFLS